MSPERLLERLAPPQGPVDVVIDTDAFNELDDQFALAYALLHPNLNVQAVYAAPFFHGRSSSPADGMEKSYQEILRVLDCLSIPGEGLAFRGADRYMMRRDDPVASPAVEDLVARAMQPRPGPLYVAALGCATNVASALVRRPALVEHIVVVWVAGTPPYRHPSGDFNLRQDVPAAQILFDSTVPLVRMPCFNVAEKLRTTLHEIEHYVAGRGRLGDYLCEVYRRVARDRYAGSRVIWDLIGPAWLANPAWVPTELGPSPVLTDYLRWGDEDPRRHPVRVAVSADRDAIFADMFRLFEHAARKGQS
jgi:inosine-uridine nucleoside N-ribohydrolase